MSTAPSGHVTLVFTDVQGSTLLWDLYPEGMQEALSVHNEVLRRVLANVGGYEVRTEGDAFVLAFHTPFDAVSWCIQAQQELLEATWPETILQSIEAGEVFNGAQQHLFRGLRVRMGVHYGEPEIRDVPLTGRVDYVGPMVHRAVGIADAGHGGQILISASVFEALSQRERLTTIDLGQHRIKWMDEPEHIFQVSAGVLAQRTFPPIRTQDAHRTNLPHYEIPFVNRQASLRALEEYFDHSHRVVTLLGPGGMGKSRLAIRYGSLRLSDYDGGVWFFDLSEATDLKDVLLTVSTVLSVPMNKVHSEAEMSEQLGFAIAGRGSILLILDNFEHVAQEAQHVVGQWMLHARSAHFIVTSRMRLGVAGERIFHLDPLNEDHSVMLFESCAVNHDASYQLDEQETACVKDIVSRLDGIPLGIELAAGQVKGLSLTDILTHLKNKIDLAAAHEQDDKSKQQTLNATIDWSWGLLESWEQSALMWCALFRNGFYLESAEDVVAFDDDDVPWVLDIIESLHDKSFLHTWDVHEFPDEIRFGMYESVRDYALQALSQSTENEKARLGHASYFLKMGREWSDGLSGAEGVKCLDRLALERDNLNATHDYFLEKDPAKAIEVLLCMHPFFLIRSPLEQYGTMLDRSLALAQKQNSQLEARVLQARGEWWWQRDEMEHAYQDYSAARQIFQSNKDLQREAQTVLQMGNAVHNTQRQASLDYWRAAQALAETAQDGPTHAKATAQIGRITKNVKMLEEAIAFFERVQDRFNEESWRIVLGTLHLDQERFDEAQDCYIRALGMARSIKDRRSEGVILGSLGIIQAEKGMVPSAAHLYEAAMSKLEEVGARVAESVFLGNLATLYFQDGQLGKARETYEAAIHIYESRGDKLNLAYFKAFFGALLAEEGEIETAQANMCEAAEVLKEIGDDLGVAAVSVCEGLVDVARARVAKQNNDMATAQLHFKAALERKSQAEKKGPVSVAHPQGQPSLATQSGDVRDSLKFLELSLRRYSENRFVESA